MDEEESCELRFLDMTERVLVEYAWVRRRNKDGCIIFVHCCCRSAKKELDISRVAGITLESLASSPNNDSIRKQVSTA